MFIPEEFSEDFSEEGFSEEGISVEDSVECGMWNVECGMFIPEEIPKEFSE